MNGPRFDELLRVYLDGVSQSFKYYIVKFKVLLK